MVAARAAGAQPPAKREPLWQSVVIAATQGGGMGILLVPLTLFGKTM